MKMFTQTKLTAGSVFLVALCLSQMVKAQQVITIQQAVDNTLKNNLTIKQAQFSAAITDENLTQSKFALYPNLNASVNPNLTFGRGLDQTTFQVTNQTSLFTSGNLSTNVDLFQGFSKINQIRQNKTLLQADLTNVEKVKNDLILNVVTAYLQVLYNTDLERASKEQLDIANKTLIRENALLDAGNKTIADISQAKSQVATAELNLTNAQNALSISYLTLGQLMEMQPNQKFVVQAPLIDNIKAAPTTESAEEIYNNALSIFPDIKLANLRSRAAKQAIDVAKGSYYPSLSLGAGINTSYSYQFNYAGLFPQTSFTDQINQRLGQSIGMSLQIPIFNGFIARSNVRRAKITYNNSLNSEQLAKNNLNKVIFQATTDLKAAESRYRSTENAFMAQKDAFYAVDLRYEQGLVNSLDYSTAQTNRNKAEIDFIQAKYDLLFRAKVIDYYLGKQITF
ncbi:TolC family protein [Pedobacter jejuensis]|uniref:TolC family protein n=1 Tax=Pedobacter jejuensis TaxID=1268550 RepID=A0A3N0BZT4_9SPHI|nr:TolC family protein [Pedobacter jejuensis]RNL55514.1 TolC family protein [Pedobacter jejuensis]